MISKDWMISLAVGLFIIAILIAVLQSGIVSAGDAAGCGSRPIKRIVGTLGELGAGGAPPCQQ